MGNSKTIGNSYEREFSKSFSLWLSNGESDDIVWRDLSSGSRATSRSKKGKETNYRSDIILTDTSGKYKKFFDIFCIDTKSFKSVDLISLIYKDTNKSKNILSKDSGWVKVVESTPENMIPIMPVKIRDSKTPELIVFPRVNSKVNVPYMQYIMKDKIDRKFKYCDPNFLIITRLEYFYSYYNWESFLSEFEFF